VSVKSRAVRCSALSVAKLFEPTQADDPNEALGTMSASGTKRGRLWKIDGGSASLRLDVEGPDEFTPLLGFVGDELAKVSG